jgi:LuxR family transcriptional regulator of spore coat protein
VSYLTDRQREILLLAANGNSNADIAAWAGTRRDTIAEILSAAYRNLGAADRANAVAIGIAVGELGIHEIRLPQLQWVELAAVGRCQEPVSGPESAREPANGAPDVREATRPPGGHTAGRGEAAA